MKINVTQYAVKGVVGFACGALIGKIARLPIMITGSILAVSIIARTLLSDVVSSVGERKGWDASKIMLVKQLGGIVATTATAVAFVAFGVFSLMGAAISVGIQISLVIAYQLAAKETQDILGKFVGV